MQGFTNRASWEAFVVLLFAYDPNLNKRLSQVIASLLQDWMQTTLGHSMLQPMMIAVNQSFGTLLNFHPHLHWLVSHRVFALDGSFVPLPRMAGIIDELPGRETSCGDLKQSRAWARERKLALPLSCQQPLALGKKGEPFLHYFSLDTLFALAHNLIT